MSTIRGIDEALEIAIKIENNGVAFYSQAARIHTEPGEAEQLLELAAMELEHRRVFEKMRASLRADGAKVPLESERRSLYVQALADAHGGEGDPFAVDDLRGDETLEEILHTAVQLEEQSILFYTGIRPMLSREQDRSAIDTIIGAEQSHVVALVERLKSI